MQSALASADQKHEAMVLEKVELTEQVGFVGGNFAIAALDCAILQFQVMALAKQLIEWKAKFEDVKEELDLAAVARTALAAEKVCRPGA